MKRLVLTAAAIAALGCGLAACESETPFQRAGPGVNSFGYSDFRIDATRWRVSFAGNSLTSRETVEKYLLYRAAQLTIEQGFDWFEPTERNTERTTNFVGTTDPYWSTWGSRWSPYWGFGGPWGWRGRGYWGPGPGWPGDIDIRQVNRYEATAEIELGRGTPPARSMDAHQVIENLGPSVIKPPQS
jgi:hypothetical protein